jgi:hypothetical protein
MSLLKALHYIGTLAANIPSTLSVSSPAVYLSRLNLNIVIVEAKVNVFYADDDEDVRFVFKSAIVEISVPVDLTCFLALTTWKTC